MKAFEVNKSNSPMITRYAFMSMMADAACVSMLLGSISLHASYDKLNILIILFNIISIGTRIIFSVIADNVNNKHTGVRMAVMILFLGFVFPIKISLTAKVVLMGLGDAAFYAFASSSILSRSKFSSYGIGMFTAGSILGLGIGRYMQFFGYFAAAFLLIAATPSDKGEEIPCTYIKSKKKNYSSFITAIFIILLLFCILSASYSSYSLNFVWNKGKKYFLLTAFSAFLGRIIGGFLYDKIPLLLPVFALGGGASIFIFYSNSKLLSLIGIMLINMIIPVMISIIFKFIPNHPAFAYSIASSASYLGYISIKLLPKFTSNPKALISLTYGFILLITTFINILFIYNSKKAKSLKLNEGTT